MRYLSGIIFIEVEGGKKKGRRARIEEDTLFSFSSLSLYSPLRRRRDGKRWYE